ncbi:MAG: RDD family protein [Phycisphaerae bacterium]
MSQSSPPPDRFKACEVTGEILPVDSLVQFQGKWVSEKGKQILLERLQSGEPTVSNEWVRPGFWRRFGCYLLDWLIFGVVELVCSVILAIATAIFALAGAGHIQSPAPAPGAPPSSWAIWFGILTLLVIYILLLLYFAYPHYKWGRTPGKYVGRLKVVMFDGSPLTFRRALLRSVLYLLPALIGGAADLIVLPFMYPSAANPAPHPPSAVMIILGIVFLAAFGWSITDGIFLIADTRYQRSLHDRLAGTRVIMSQDR